MSCMWCSAVAWVCAGEQFSSELKNNDKDIFPIFLFLRFFIAASVSASACMTVVLSYRWILVQCLDSNYKFLTLCRLQPSLFSGIKKIKNPRLKNVLRHYVVDKDLIFNPMLDTKTCEVFFLNTVCRKPWIGYPVQQAVVSGDTEKNHIRIRIDDDFQRARTARMTPSETQSTE